MGVFGIGDGDEGGLNIMNQMRVQIIEFLLKFCGRGGGAKSIGQQHP